MTCADVQQLIDGFLDTELSPPMLLDVARHAASCASCDADVRDLTELREIMVRNSETAVDALDLSGVWSTVAAGIARDEVTAARRRRWKSIPAWAPVAALAASLLVWVSIPGDVPTAQAPAPVEVASVPKPFRPVSRQQRNHAYIDRLAGKDIAVRREPKSGTTIIWVNHTVDTAH